MKRTFGHWSGQRPVFSSVSLVLAGVLGFSGCSRKRVSQQIDDNSARVQTLAQTPNPLQGGAAPAAKPKEGNADAESSLPVAAWPREYGTEAGQTVVLYEPEVEQWNDFETMRVRAALEVREDDEMEPVYGAMWMSGQTDTDTDARSVLFTGRQIDEVRFPGIAEAESGKMRQIVDAALPESEPLVFNLDRVLSSVDGSVQGEENLKVGLDPPPIFYSSQPAMLIIFLGEPAFDVVREGSGLEFCVNTNWDLFRVTESGRYYVQVEEGWMETDDVLQGPWREVADLPAVFSELPDDENWTDVRANLPGKKLAVVPRVFVSSRPAEMIVTAGPAEFEELQGSALSYAVNTDSTVFLHREEKNVYFLAAGRWFRAPAFEGPWSAATFDLPEDFQRLPEGAEWADVRAAVPGTREAEEAALLASIPRKAEVNRDEAELEVDYDGEPVFAPVEGAQNISYATNTSYDVLSVATGPATQYYACHQGVWFLADTPHGPWVLCDTVPDVVYTIPPSSPKYHVSYVRVYDSTPTTVVTGYYPGYLGTYVVGGALLFGLGYWIGSEIYDDDYYHHHHHYWRGYRYRPYWYSYGSGAHYRHAHGGYLRTARYYGPYGGAGRIAVWNPYSRSYVRGYEAYGSRRGEWARSAYQPFTDTWRGRVRASSPYDTWERDAVRPRERWRDAARWEERRRVSGEGNELGEGRLLRAGRTRRDGRELVLSGDELRAGRDGQVYRQREERLEKWEKDKGWETAPAAETAERQGRRNRGDRGTVAISRPAGRDSSASRTSRVEPERDRVRTEAEEGPARRAREEGRPEVADGEEGRNVGRRSRERDGDGRTEERPGIVDGSRDEPASGRRGAREAGTQAEGTESSDRPGIADGNREADADRGRTEAGRSGRREDGVEVERGNREGSQSRERDRAEGSPERRPGIVDGTRDRDSTERRRVTGDGPDRPPGKAEGRTADPDRGRDSSARESRATKRESQPAARERQPAKRESQPATRERQPAKRESQPAARERQSTKRESQPAARERQPEKRQAQPAARERQPAKRAAQPAARERKPSAQQSRPATRERQSSARQQKPSSRQAGKARSSGGGGRERERDKVNRRK